jgi:hypothetical protein
MKQGVIVRGKHSDSPFDHTLGTPLRSLARCSCGKARMKIMDEQQSF